MLCPTGPFAILEPQNSPCHILELQKMILKVVKGPVRVENFLRPGATSKPVSSYVYKYIYKYEYIYCM